MGALYEIKKQWTIDDLWDAHEAMDIQEEAQQWAMEQSEKK